MFLALVESASLTVTACIEKEHTKNNAMFSSGAMIKQESSFFQCG